MRKPVLFMLLFMLLFSCSSQKKQRLNEGTLASMGAFIHIGIGDYNEALNSGMKKGLIRS